MILKFMLFLPCLQKWYVVENSFLIQNSKTIVKENKKLAPVLSEHKTNFHTGNL